MLCTTRAGLAFTRGGGEGGTPLDVAIPVATPGGRGGALLDGLLLGDPPGIVVGTSMSV